jgi:hypothetical protein
MIGVPTSGYDGTTFFAAEAIDLRSDGKLLSQGQGNGAEGLMRHATRGGT